jgi:uncharacterized membrane protein
LVRPPMQSPDEFNHFWRTYQISTGQFHSQKQDQRLGGELPESFKEIYYYYRDFNFVIENKLDKEDFLRIFKIPVSKRTVFFDFPNTAIYSPICYLPQAFVISVLNRFNCSAGVLYYGAIWFAFLVYVTVGYWIIRTMMLYRWMLTVCLLLPMNTYMINSLNADLMTNLLSLTLIAVTLQMRTAIKEFDVRYLLIFSALAVMITLSKVVYGALLLLLLTIPCEKFGSVQKKWVYLGLIFSLAIAVAFFNSRGMDNLYISYGDYNPAFRAEAALNPEANPENQKQLLVSHPLAFIQVVYKSITKPAWFYLKTYIGAFGSCLEVSLPDYTVRISLVVLVLIALFEKNVLVFSIRDKIVLVVTVAIVFSLLVLSLHIIWNKPGFEAVNGIQGRYLIPIVPVVLMLFSNDFSSLKINFRFLAVIFIIIIQVQSLKLIYNRFLNDKAKQKTDISYNIGNGEIKVNPHSSSGILLVAEQIEKGDLVHIKARQIGDSGYLAVEGRGEGCNSFRYENSELRYTDVNGAHVMRLLFTFFEPCKHAVVGVTAANRGDDTVMFRDISLRIRRYHRDN